jgi:hypothetical protein
LFKQRRFIFTRNRPADSEPKTRTFPFSMNTKNDIDELAKKEAFLVRRAAGRATRELARKLIESYDWLNTEAERREFCQTHQETLKHTGGLLGVCMAASKPLSSRARAEFRAISGDGKMPRWAFERLSPRDRIRFVQLGGRLKDRG